VYATAPPGDYIYQFMLASHTAWMLTVGPCTAFLFMSRHLHYLLVLWLQYACKLLLQWHWESHFLFLRFA